jgi:WD40 repeat protein
MAVDRVHMEAACGSSDHAVYCVDVGSSKGARAPSSSSTGAPPAPALRPSRTLYGSRTGHTEWVTSVAYVGDGSGRVVSAGMDGKVCVWGARATGKSAAASELVGHFGSVSAVASPGGGTAACGPASAAWGGFVVSAGYDKTVRLWDASPSGGGACVMTAKAHGAPVLSLSLLATGGGGGGGAAAELWGVSGDRDGVANVWRLHDGVVEGALRGHKGHLTACAWVPADAGADDETGAGGGGGGSSSTSASGGLGGANLVVTGAQDGHVRVWDVRTRECVANVGAHASESGSGAVGDICVARSGGSGGGGPSETVLVTAGADRRVCVLDPRAGFSVRHAFTEHRDFIYSLACTSSLACSGGGDGMLLVHDVSLGRPLWAVGAGMAAVRAIGFAGRHMVATGDDGKVLVYDF